MPAKTLFYILETPLGEMYTVLSDEGIHVLEFHTSEKMDERLKRLSGPVQPGVPDLPVYCRLAEELDLWFSGNIREFSLPAIPSGTPFQKQVWNELQNIPYGQTISYEALSDRLGDRKSIRAAAAANGANPIAILIPCHRVIGKDGSLTGYAGGLHRKRQLLDLERRTLGDAAYKSGDQMELL